MVVALPSSVRTGGPRARRDAGREGRCHRWSDEEVAERDGGKHGSSPPTLMSPLRTSPRRTGRCGARDVVGSDEYPRARPQGAGGEPRRRRMRAAAPRPAREGRTAAADGGRGALREADLSAVEEGTGTCPMEPRPPGSRWHRRGPHRCEGCGEREIDDFDNQTPDRSRRITTPSSDRQHTRPRMTEGLGANKHRKH